MERGMRQVELISLEDLVPRPHVYRKLLELYPERLVSKQLSGLESSKGANGYGLGVLFKCLLLQFMENLSDRELERYLQENTAAKWFCGFNLSSKTPDYSLFCKIRSKIGTELMSKIFASIRDVLKSHGYVSEVFTFVDATHLIAKTSLWKERDEAIKQKLDKLNNEVLPKIAHDKQARIGCKGKDKYWYGYKEHVSVDMKHGLINKVAITPANVADAKGLRHICPRSGAIYADKGYCTSNAHRISLKKGATLRAIKKNNMKDKNKDLDRWISSIRSPFEGVFSKREKRVRYIGIRKNQFASLMNALSFNLKRLIVIAPPGYAIA
jgi:transposase, IS5 family